MFDVGFWEMSMIGLIALIVLGPERLPKVARTAGLWIGRAKRMVSDVKADVNREIRMSELKELEELKSSVAKTGKDFKESMDDVGDELKKGSEGLNIKDAIEDSANQIASSASASATEESNEKR